MFFSSLFRACCVGATLWTVSGQRPSQGSNTACWTCDQSPGCFECVSKANNGNGTSTVKLDFSGCKGDDISWACCTGSTGPDNEFNAGECDVPDLGCFGKDDLATDPEGPKCETVSTMFVLVPSDAVSVTINTHDGAIRNSAVPPIGADPICAGEQYQGGRCATRNNRVTAHCLETIDLATCPADHPSIFLSEAPSKPVTKSPSISPTNVPTTTPSAQPTPIQTKSPTLSPSNIPSAEPTLSPTKPPTVSPSIVPSSLSHVPSAEPTLNPTKPPTVSPSIVPSTKPTPAPTKSSTPIPSSNPSETPTASPTVSPTGICFNNLGDVCRERVDACDIEERCIEGDDSCPDCDHKFTGGFALKCGRKAFLCGIPDFASLGCNIGGPGVSTVVNLAYPECLEDGTIEIDSTCKRFDNGLASGGLGLSGYAVAICTDVGGSQFWTCTETDTPSDNALVTLIVETNPDACDDESGF
ncbi:hypothetical protein FisN_27Lh099 [Fistulifera solaris]|uniref:Uncharacterized protein n=1 Tax=Fistulifera solaris TaxID=1519565 RepID=A0A1Z5KAZ4_FISSO|nr:hypothetical protein FisN_27Lh099 [Fistulifera solaris]|eukprot:GAX23325.1 hypothetical protein FisN_27Lh099 [Fistulifera solaris]